MTAFDFRERLQGPAVHIVIDEPAAPALRAGDRVTLGDEPGCIVPAGTHRVSRVNADGSFHVGGNTAVWPRRIIAYFPSGSARRLGGVGAATNTILDDLLDLWADIAAEPSSHTVVGVTGVIAGSLGTVGLALLWSLAS